MDVLEQLIALLEKRKAEILNSLGDGYASSYDAYKQLVGQRQGVQMALDILDDLLTEKDDDEHE